MRAPYSLEHAANRKGWTVIKSIPILGDGVQAPGAVTMCEIGGAHPYAIHFFNEQDGGFHSGNYCPDRRSAEVVYAARVLRYGGLAEPWDTDGDLQNENGEGQEAENDRWATRTFRE